MTRDPRTSYSYPNLAPDLWIIWSRGVGHIKWPDPRRNLTYKSAWHSTPVYSLSPDFQGSIPNWTRDWNAAATFDCEQSGRDWIFQELAHPFIRDHTYFLTPVPHLQFIEFGIGEPAPEPTPIKWEDCKP